MENTLDIKALNDLIKLAEEALEKEKDNNFSPVIIRAKSMIKSAIPENFHKVKFTALLQGLKKHVLITEETDLNSKFSVSINWIISLLKNLHNKVNSQSELITDLMRKSVSKDDLKTELEKKHEQIEADLPST